MPELNKRAVLEAVIAGGLVAIGIPTGQVPLLAVAAAATSVGCNWTYSLAERGFQHWCGGWFSDDGVLNHDIAKALCHAFEEAVRQVERDWKQDRHYLYLKRKSTQNPKEQNEAQLTLDALQILREAGSDLFQQPDQLRQVAQREQQEQVLSLLSQDEAKANEFFKSALGKYLYGHDEVFVTFVTARLGPKWVVRFLEILKDAGEEGTRAWRACQLLWQQSLMLAIGQIQRTAVETADTVQWLKKWVQQLQSQPPTQRDTTGQDALEDMLSKMHAQLDEIQAATKRIDITTTRTDETATRIETKLDKLHPTVAPADIVPVEVWNVPYLRNPYFTGREEVLEQLRDTLNVGKAVALTQPPAPPQVLSGLGGIGKTQIAVEYAYRYRDKYRFILWVRAASRETLIADFVALADLLNLQEKQEQDQNITVAAVKRWLEAHDQWLLIFDNADELEVVYDFLPAGGKGHILLTTRAQAAGSLAQSIEVEKMEKSDGTLLLLRRAKVLPADAPLNQASQEDQARAGAIVLAMDGLPLALEQAGAYIEESRCGLADYLDIYRTRRKELLARRSKLARNYPLSVATTWSLSFQKVEEANAAAAELLRLCAFLAPDAIPEDMIKSGATELGDVLGPVVTDPFKLNEALEVVGDYSLVRRNPASRMLSIHRLVQVVLKDGMDEPTQRQWAERTVQAVNQAFPDVTNVNVWPQCERYLPQALACADLIAQYTLEFPQAALLLSRTAYYLHDHALYPQAESLYEQALAIYKKVLGEEHPDTATSLNNLALLYKTQGKYEEAEPLYQQALAITQKVLGDEHPNTASSLNNLAELYRAQGKYEQAEPLYQQALAIRRKALGEEHPDTAQSLNNLAGLYWAQGKYEQAEPLYQQALAIRRKVLGDGHPDTAQSLNNLAGLYWAQGKYEEAEPLYEQALAITQKVLGDEHPNTASSLNNLAELYRTQGKYEQAEPLYEQALAIYQKVLGDEHPDTAGSLNNLATLYQAQGKDEEAEPLYQQALAIRRKVLGDEHPDTATSLNNLALLYKTQGKYEEAEPLLKQALAIRKKVLGDEHPDTAGSLNNLAELYKAQGKYAQAEPLYQQALAIYQKALGDEHPDTAQSLNNLAVLYWNQGKYEEAEPLLKQALAIRKKVLGDKHPNTKVVRKNYQVLIGDMKRKEEGQ